MADPCLESNQWVNLSMSPLSQLQVNLVPSSRSTNAFRLDADGIYVPGFQESTSIPSAISGDMWRYENQDNPAIQWAFVFSEAAGAWTWIGGSPVYDEVATTGTRAGNASPVYGDLVAAGGGGSGPSVTLPFSGTYTFHFGALVGSAADGTYARMSLQFGAVAATDADSVATTNDNVAAISRRMTRTVSAAGTIVSAKYKNLAGAGGPDASFTNRWLSVQPVSVG